METHKLEISKLETELEKLQIPVKEIEEEMKKLEKKLRKEKKKITDREYVINTRLKHLKYLDFLYKSKKPVVFLDDCSEVLGDFCFWDVQKEKLKDEFDIKECSIKIQYKTPYYACGNKDDRPDYNFEPINVEITYKKEKINANDSRIDYIKVLDHYQGEKVETEGDSDGLYDILTVELECSVYTKK